MNVDSYKLQIKFNYKYDLQSMQWYCIWVQEFEWGNLPATGNRQLSKNHARLYR